MLSFRSAGLLSALVMSSGCNGIFWGNLGVLCVTVGIFLGTVFLSRTNNARSATRSTTTARPPSSTTNT